MCLYVKPIDIVCKSKTFLYICNQETFKPHCNNQIYYNMIQLKNTIIRFANNLKQEETDFFRGAVINTAEMSGSVLFHNHTPEGLRWGYPLIQYKSLDGRAAIVGIGEGADELLKVRPYLDREMHIGIKAMNFNVVSTEEITSAVGLSKHLMHYVLTGWMPFNQQNVRVFHTMKDERERNIMLESILVGNILAFFKGIKLFVDDNVVCRIESRSPIQNTLYKNMKMKTIDVAFYTNAILPNCLGLGRGTSLGHGTITLN